MRLAVVGLAASTQERHRPGLQPPALLGARVGIGVPPHPHVVVRLVDEQQRLRASAGVAVEVEQRGPGEEQPLRRGFDESRKVDERVRRAECAVGAIRCEHLVHDPVDVVLRHGDGVLRQQLLDLNHVGDW